MIPKASIGIRDSNRAQIVPSIPPSFVKSAIAAPTTAADSHAVAFSGGVTAGNLIIVAVATFASVGSGEVSGVTDSLGNTYSRVVNVQGQTSTAMWLSIHVAQNIFGGACTVTANAIGTSAFHTISAHEYSGAVLSNAVDASAIQRNASSTSAPSPTTPPTTVDADLVFAAMTFGGSTTTISAPSTGYTQRTEDENGSTVMPINTADKQIAVTGAQIATWTLGAARESLCGIIAIKGSGAGAPPDTQDPSSFTLSSPSQTSSTIDLSWTAATDNVGVIGYDIYVEGSFHSTTTSLSATIGSLTASTSYPIYVDARDAAGNTTASNSITPSTLADSGGTGFLALPLYTGTGTITPGVASRSGASNFTISGAKFRNTSQGVNGGAGLILTSCNNVIIEDCWFDGCAGTNPPSNIAALTLTSCTNITVRNCVFSNCSWGILAHQSGTSGIKVLDNEFINMVGSRAPYGCCRGQAVYYAEFTPSAGNEIKRNKIMNFLGEAWQDGDIISIYVAGGTSGSHLVVEENIIYGSIGGRNGCAIIVGDQSSGPLNVDIFANRIFKHAIAGISVSGGSFITERNNRVWAERNEWSGNAYNAFANPTPCSNIDINTSNLAFSQLYNLHPTCPGCREDAYFPGSCSSSSLAVGSLGSTAAAAYAVAISGISDPSVSSLLSTDDFMRVRADKTWYTEIVNHGNVGVVDGTSSHRRVDCTRPVANAGVDQNVSITTAQLNGSGSSNTNPPAPMTGTNTIEHHWVQVSGPNTATMSNSSAAINNLSNLINGTYIFRLDVTQTQVYNNTTFADSVNYQTQHSDWMTIIKT